MKKASDILSQFLDHAQLEKARTYNSFFRSWKSIVGTDIASHSRVKEIEKGKLIVEADHPGWAQKIEWKKRGILRDVKRRYPELAISEIRVWIVDSIQIEEVEEHTAPIPADLIETVQEEAEKKEHEPKKKAEDDQQLQGLLNRLGKFIEDADGEQRH